MARQPIISSTCLPSPKKTEHYGNGKANIDPNAVMFQTFAQTPRVGSNGGTAAELVGSYDTVAKRIAAFHRAGIELFMLQFQPFEADMRAFAEEVIPRVHRLLKQ